jgi:hypothetical protein
MFSSLTRRAFGAAALAPVGGQGASSGTALSTGFIEALLADSPAGDRADKMGLYAFLIGSWRTEIKAYEPNGTMHTSRGEIHAGWVLEGRAIQDVWITPPRAERRPDQPPLPVTGSWYGTTLRIYDPGIDAWHILWNDPPKAFFTRQIGRARGGDIVQEGKYESGALSRWSFTEIQPGSFRWLGEISADGGATWQLQVEVLATRV